MFSEDARLMQSILASSPMKILWWSTCLGVVTFLLPLGDTVRQRTASAIRHTFFDDRQNDSGLPRQTTDTLLLPEYVQGTL
ncbi:MAG: hypothetical protein ACR2JE_03490 [Acidobacteriaceae bacterium]